MSRTTRSHSHSRRRDGIGIALLLVGFLSLAATAHAAVFYVDAMRPHDLGDGQSWSTAKQTIGGAIAVSAVGDEILVKYGLYPIAMAIVLSDDRLLTSDDGTHTSYITAVPDPEQCPIVAAGTSRVMTVSGAAVTGATRIRGFELTGGNATSEGDPNNGYGGGLKIDGGASPVVDRCWITDNLAGATFNGRGGGVAVTDAGSSLVLRDSRVANNRGSTAWFADGGGIYCGSGTTVEIDGCDIVDNVGSTARVGAGGGVFFSGGNGELHHSNISGNTAAGQYAGGGGRGGGVYAAAGNIVIRECTIDDNRAGRGAGEIGYGGGLYVDGEDVVVRDNPSISGNIAATQGRGFGGGISCGGGPTIRNNVIVGNTATVSDVSSDYFRFGAGGGITLFDSGTECSGNVIAGNTASENGEGRGGGITFESGNVILRNVIRDNVASPEGPGNGGGAWSYNAGLSVLENNDFIGNANVITAGALGDGSGWFHLSGGVPRVRNNIFCDHDVTGSDQVAVHGGIAFGISNTCFDNNPGGHTNANVTSNEALITAPGFVDPAAHDYSLRFDSPCIEAGHPDTAVPEHGGWRVDIGAFEYTGVRHRRPVVGAGEYLFGGQVRAKVLLTDPGTLTEIDMVVHPGESHPEAIGAVGRWFAIAAAGAPGLFDLTLSYRDEEVGGQDEATLAQWRWTGVDWEGPKLATAADLSENWLTVSGQTAFSDWVMADLGGPVGVVSSETPARLRVGSVHPNPFNPRVLIRYELPAAGRVRLAILDLRGRVVCTLVEERRLAGSHEVIWDGYDDGGRAVATGVYVARLVGKGAVDARKLTLIR